jgi:hypothetical protein
MGRMKRFRQWLVAVLAALSLVLATLLIVLWISRILPRQFWIRLPSVRINTDHRYFVTSGGENVFFVSNVQLNNQRIIGPLNANQSAVASFKSQFGQPIFRMSWLHFKSLTEPVYFTEANGHISMAGTRTIYGIPYGYFLMLFLLLPAWRWLPLLIRRTRARFIISPGICRNCGYDLRATPDRCPECGAIPSKREIISN